MDLGHLPFVRRVAAALRRARARVGERSTAATLDRALARLDQGERVAVLAPRTGAGWREVVDAHAGSLRITVLEAGLPPWRQHGRLAGAGPFALLADAGGPQGQVARFRRCFQHVRPGGVYLALVPARAARRHSGEQDLRQYLAQVRGKGRGDGGRQERFAATVGRVSEVDGRLSAVRRGRSLAILRHREMTEALRTDPTRGGELQTVPGVEVASRCEVTRSPYHDVDLRIRTELEAPDLHLREYHDVVCARGGLVLQRNLVVPDSFRHHLVPVLSHNQLRPVGGGFAVPRGIGKDPRSLPGAYFHLDNSPPGHFGHMLTEQLSRLWGWEEARRRYPDCKVILGSRTPGEIPGWQRTLLEAADIRGDDLEIFRRPTQVEHLVTAMPMYSMTSYVHPALTETWDRLAERLLAAAPDRAYPRRLFVTRTHKKRACRNRREVEELFARHGFEVVLPQRFSIPEQVAMFHHAEVIGGFAGSAFFTAMFSRSPKHLVVVSPTSYRSTNEYLISGLRGHQVTLVACRSEIDQPERGRSGAAFRSGFTCDMEREGRWLAGVLAGL